MKIYYYANQVYQFSYALPIFQAAGGKILYSKFSKWFQFKKHLRKKAVAVSNTLNGVPPLQRCDRNNLYDLEGVILSLSNANFKCDHQKCKTIYIGHGSGDKKYDSDARILESYDYHFISGEKHLQKIRDLNLNIGEEKLIKIGNLRFDFYLKNEKNRAAEFDRLGIVDRQRKNVLYAPTWKWGNGTFHKYAHRFCEEITKKYNLIIRPHHHDRRSIPAIKLWAAFSGIKHVYFSNPADILRSDTMNDFLVSDILISDTSSVVYEYLIANKPIIIAKNDYHDLHNMPDNMDIMNYAAIFDGSGDIVKLIEAGLKATEYKKKYRQLLNSCFYFNDGHSVDRALKFIKNLESK